MKALRIASVCALCAALGFAVAAAVRDGEAQERDWKRVVVVTDFPGGTTPTVDVRGWSRITWQVTPAPPVDWNKPWRPLARIYSQQPLAPIENVLRGSRLDFCPEAFVGSGVGHMECVGAEMALGIPGDNAPYAVSAYLRR